MEKKKVLEKQLHNAAFKLAKKLPIEQADMHLFTYSVTNPHVRVCFDVHDESLKADLIKIRELEKSDTSWNENKERIAIRNAINGVKSGRVEAMLADEETNKKLKALGSEIGVL